MKEGLFKEMLKAYTIHALLFALAGYIAGSYVWITGDKDLFGLNFMATVMITVFVVLGIGVGIFFARKISERIAKLSEASKKIAQGDLNIDITPGKEGEIRELEETFQQMVLNLRLLGVEMAGNCAMGTSVCKQRGKLSTKLALGFILNGILISLASQVLFMPIMPALAIGIPNILFGIATGSLLAKMSADVTSRSLSHITRAAKTVQEGNLTVSVNVGRKDEIGVLAASFNDMVAALRAAVEIINAGESVPGDAESSPGGNGGA